MIGGLFAMSNESKKDQKYPINIAVTVIDKITETIRRPVTLSDKRLAERCLKGRIILIDDDPEIIAALVALLDMEGYACDTYISASQFLQEQQCNRPSFPGPWCILSDIKMPGIDGLELQRQLLEMGEPPLIMMSGESGAYEAVAGLRGGALDFLIKPFDADIALLAIERALAVSKERMSFALKNSDITIRFSGLTSREADIVKRVARGQLNREIAEELDIALRTVKLHRQRAFEKLGVTKLVELVRLIDTL
ncbi:MAG: hypothetical protein RIQ94_1176 [Pseudomonadota bacterium]